MSLLLRWLASVGALLLVAAFVPGIVIDDVPTAFVAALVLGVVNGVLGPVVRLLALPIRLLTLGLFSLVINAALFALAALLVPGFRAEGVVAAFVGALAYGLLAGLIQGLFGVRKT
jgi:putative membrane protein